MNMRAQWIGLLVMLAAVLPGTSYAAGLDINTCAPGFPDGAYTAKIVVCVQSMIIQVVNSMIVPLSNYMTNTVVAMMILALCVFGIRIMGGEKDLTRKGISFLLRLSLVWMFSYALGGMWVSIYDILDGLMAAVTNGYSPWVQIDRFIGRIFGFGQDASGGVRVLSQSLMGIMGAGLMTSVGGGIMFLAGIFALMNLMFFVFRVLYMYLMAMVGIGFLILISPLIIPMAIFLHTERYFKVWLDILIATMLVPVLMFAFLSMFLNGFSVMVENIFAVLGSNNNVTDFRAFWKTNQAKGSWTMPNDPNFSNRIAAQTGHAQIVPAVPSNINALMRRAHEMNVFKGATIDFGPATVRTMQRLVFMFMQLFIYAMLMKEMLSKIPDIANGIAGARAAIGSTSTGLEGRIRSAAKRATAKFAAGNPTV